jgi:hypothetical protein
MKTFKQYNESVRDQMTPRSEEEYIKVLEEGKSYLLEEQTIDDKLVNESIRDKMTPKSEKEVRQSLLGLSFTDKFLKGCEYGVEWAVKRALINGVNVHLHEEEGLINSVDNNHLDIVELLLNAGADVHINDEQPLCLAILGGNIEMIKLLLKYGANPHKNNDVPLKLAGNMEDTEILKTIEDYGK